MKRSVVLVTGEYPPAQGGIADYTAHLARGLRQRGFSVAVVTRQIAPHVKRKPCPCDDRLASSAVYRDLPAWDARALARLARRTPRDAILHLQYQPAAFDLRGEMCVLPLLLRVARPDVRVVTTFHDTRVPYLFPRAGALRRRAVQALARGSHAVLAADPADLAWLGGPSARHHLVPIGPNVAPCPPAHFDRAAYRARLGLGSDHLGVAYFGFLNASKGLDVLLQAFARVAAQEPSARLLVLGGAAGASDPTDRQTAHAFAERVGSLGDRVVRTGYLPPADLSAHLLAADVALLPYADGASARRGSLLACAAHGLPIVSTDGPGVALNPLLRDAMLTRDPTDAAGLADAVLDAWRTPALRAHLHAGSARLARATAWDTIVDHHLAIYAEL